MAHLKYNHRICGCNVHPKLYLFSFCIFVHIWWSFLKKLPCLCSTSIFIHHSFHTLHLNLTHFEGQVTSWRYTHYSWKQTADTITVISANCLYIFSPFYVQLWTLWVLSWISLTQLSYQQLLKQTFTKPVFMPQLSPSTADHHKRDIIDEDIEWGDN